MIKVGNPLVPPLEAEIRRDIFTLKLLIFWSGIDKVAHAVRAGINSDWEEIAEVGGHAIPVTDGL